MEADVILDASPIVISSAALLVTVLSMRRQWRSARNANAVTAILKLFEEYRADDLRTARRAVFQMPDYPVDSSPALRDLPDDVRIAAERVALYFDHVGLLVGHHLIPASSMISYFGVGCVALWKKLESHIVAERRLRQLDYYLAYFEGFARLSQQVNPGSLVEKTTGNMRFRHMPLD